MRLIKNKFKNNKKSDHLSRRERTQLPQRKECVYFYCLTGEVIYLWALLSASHPCSYQTQHRRSFVAVDPLSQS